MKANPGKKGSAALAAAAVVVLLLTQLVAAGVTRAGQDPTPPPPPTDTPSPPPPPTDTPTPTPPCLFVWIDDIEMSYQSQGAKYRAEATVTVVWGPSGPTGPYWPAEDATVYGSFSGATSDDVSGDTGADGRVTLVSSSLKGGGTWEFCVTDVEYDCHIYVAAFNVETCDSITAP
jgi:hypothetical protein